jgi:hypothetical protein
LIMAQIIFLVAYCSLTTYSNFNVVTYCIIRDIRDCGDWSYHKIKQRQGLQIPSEDISETSLPVISCGPRVEVLSHLRSQLRQDLLVPSQELKETGPIVPSQEIVETD